MVYNELTFITGGVRSGKSAYAERLLVEQHEKNPKRLVYIASGRRTDDEMNVRIKRHEQQRSHLNWLTYERPTALHEVIEHLEEGDYILWDCATTWLANELYEGFEKGEACIEIRGCMEAKYEQLQETIALMCKKSTVFVIVSNELLDEYVTDEEVSTYARWLGEIHQHIVQVAATAIEIDHGIITYWKGADCI